MGERLALDRIEAMAQTYDPNGWVRDNVPILIEELRLAREVVDQLPHPGLLNAAGNSSGHNEIRLQFYAASDALAAYLHAYNQAAKP